MMQFLPKLLMALVVLIMSASIVFAALTVEAAKQQGLVGERPDGMLGIVAAPSPDVTALVESINTERLAKYQAIAMKNGTGLEQVKALAGQKLIQGAGSGEYIMNAAGVWQKK
jgi:uncharacterized protein YdbL (DUF1318 family)